MTRPLDTDHQPWIPSCVSRSTDVDHAASTQYTAYVAAYNITSQINQQPEKVTISQTLPLGAIYLTNHSRF